MRIWPAVHPLLAYERPRCRSYPVLLRFYLTVDRDMPSRIPPDPETAPTTSGNRRDDNAGSHQHGIWYRKPVSSHTRLSQRCGCMRQSLLSEGTVIVTRRYGGENVESNSVLLLPAGMQRLGMPQAEPAYVTLKRPQNACSIKPPIKVESGPIHCFRAQSVPPLIHA